MSEAIARFFAARQFVSTALAIGCVLLSGCIDKNYTPPPIPERPSHYDNQTTSAPYGAATDYSDSRANMGVAEITNIKVALLLPMTGRHADLGRALEHAATLAVFDKYAGLSPEKLKTRLQLVPLDTGDTIEDARDAAEKAIAEQVSLIIGPVFGDMVDAVAPMVQQAGIPLISFSNNPAVAHPGVYIFGFSPEQQAARVISYTLTGGKTRLAALTPRTPYGDSVLAAMQRAMRLQDFPIVAQATYSAQGTGVEEALDTLIPPGSAPAFDALFLPESGPALETILRSIDGRTPQRIGLIGTGLWDDYNLIRKVNLQGAWLASSPPMLTRAFEKRFAKTYQYQPPRIASLAYDAVSLAVTLATSGRGFGNEVITHPAGFSGPANGIFRFLPNGTSERGLAVIMVQSAGYIVLDPAPTSFNVTP